MRAPSNDKLKETLRLHDLWLSGTKGGVRADLSGANLNGANLSGANLNSANLRWANLSRADLNSANLNGANLNGANLRWANLSRADLNSANLRWTNMNGANLSGADLSRADLNSANLSGADLRWTNMNGANLGRAYLSGTCLDPKNKPNGDVGGFRRRLNYVYGYRTDTGRGMPSDQKYVVGYGYAATVFSTCETECHPGLYLLPTAEEVSSLYPGENIVQVKARAKDVHRAGNKWRCKGFFVTRRVKTAKRSFEDVGNGR